MEQAQAPSAPAESTPEGVETPLDAPIENTEEGFEADMAEDNLEVAEKNEDGTPKAARFKRKVNGKMVEATEDELWKHYGLEVSAREKMQEAARVKKEAEDAGAINKRDRDALAEFLTSMQKKPEMAFDLLEKMGHNAKEVARQLVLRELEYERMSPEAKDAYDAKIERDRYKAELEAERKEKTDKAEREANDRVVKEIDDTMAEALKLSGLAPKPKTVARMAEACQTLLNASKDQSLPSPQKIVEKFLAYMRQDASDLMGEQDVEKLIELGLLTENSIDRIVKHHLEKTKKNLPSFGSAKGSNPEKKEPAKKQKIGINQWFDKL